MRRASSRRGAIARHEACELKIGIAVDDQDAIEARGAASFDEQRYRHDDVGAGRRLATRVGELADGGMQQRFEPLSLLEVLEDPFAQFLAIQRAVAAQHLHAEMLGDLAQQR